MIISASRRTDIPAFYSEWLLNRLNEGYALIPNPRNADRIGHVELSPKKVDCIVFWTKNPIPLFDILKQFDKLGYHYYMQFTLTPYDKTIESNLPPKTELTQAFIEMSKRTSKKQAVWRYDPIILDSKQTIEWHVGQFATMCEQLCGYTERCILSFVDPYKSIGDRFRSLTQDEMHEVARRFPGVAKLFSIGLYTCAEEINLSQYGITHASCIDQGLIEEIIGHRIVSKKDGNQRPACRCIESIDIGVYDTCSHCCAYCYATSSRSTMLRRVSFHDPTAPMITGYPTGNEIVTDRTTASQIVRQISLF